MLNAAPIPVIPFPRSRDVEQIRSQVQAGYQRLAESMQLLRLLQRLEDHAVTFGCPLSEGKAQKNP